MIVTFCGHGDLSEDEKERICRQLDAKIENLILQGGTEFALKWYMRLKNDIIEIR